jgi:hypothetical protein
VLNKGTEILPFSYLFINWVNKYDHCGLTRFPKAPQWSTIHNIANNQWKSTTLYIHAYSCVFILEQPSTLLPQSPRNRHWICRFPLVRDFMSQAYVRTRKSYKVLKTAGSEKRWALLKTVSKPSHRYCVGVTRISIHFGIPLQDHRSRSHVSVIHHWLCTRNQSSRILHLATLKGSLFLPTNTKLRPGKTKKATKPSELSQKKEIVNFVKSVLKVYVDRIDFRLVTVSISSRSDTVLIVREPLITMIMENYFQQFWQSWQYNFLSCFRPLITRLRKEGGIKISLMCVCLFVRHDFFAYLL